MPEPAEQGPAGPLPEASFPTRLWGYDRRAVDAYVELARSTVAEALAAGSVDGAVKAALDRVGEETSAVLQQAHQIAEELVARARQEAHELEATTQAEARELSMRSQAEAHERLQRAEDEAAAIRLAAEERVAALDREIDKLWQERARTLEDMERMAADLRSVVSAADERLPAAQEPSDERERPGAEPAASAETLVHDAVPGGARAAEPENA